MAMVRPRFSVQNFPNVTHTPDRNTSLYASTVTTECDFVFLLLFVPANEAARRRFKK